MKMLLSMIFIIFLSCIWQYYLKNKLQQFRLSRSLLDPQFLVAEGQALETLELPCYQLPNQEEIRLFDDVAKLLFEKQIRKFDLADAKQIQHDFLNKMPSSARSQINQFDLGEWSVFWNYKNQSLEYYASRYGIFYTHVDAEGKEHKQEYKKYRVS